MLQIEPIPAFSDNYIWLLYDDTGNGAWVVDPGDAQPVIDTLARKGLTLLGVIITHHHFDHVGGLETLCERYDCRVYGPQNPEIGAITDRLSAGDSAEVLGLRFDVIEVPGHTLDHIAYFHDGENPILLCGGHPVCRRLRACFRGHSTNDAQLLASAGGAALVNASVLRPRIHTRQSRLCQRCRTR